MENDFNWKAAKLSLCCWCANQSFETCQNWRLKLQGTLPNHRNHSLDKVSRKCVPSIGLIYDNINSNGVGCAYHIQLCLYFSSLFTRSASLSLCFSLSSDQLNENSNEFCKVNARQKNVFKYFWCGNSNSGIVTHLCGEQAKQKAHIELWIDTNFQTQYNNNDDDDYNDDVSIMKVKRSEGKKDNGRNHMCSRIWLARYQCKISYTKMSQVIRFSVQSHHHCASRLSVSNKTSTPFTFCIDRYPHFGLNDTYPCSKVFCLSLICCAVKTMRWNSAFVINDYLFIETESNNSSSSSSNNGNGNSNTKLHRDYVECLYASYKWW